MHNFSLVMAELVSKQVCQGFCCTEIFIFWIPTNIQGFISRISIIPPPPTFHVIFFHWRTFLYHFFPLTLYFSFFTKAANSPLPHDYSSLNIFIPCEYTERIPHAKIIQGKLTKKINIPACGS